jgi:hypothetical protein
LIQAGSHLPSVEHKYVRAACRKILNVSHRRLPFRASESALNGREIVKVQYCYQVIA